MLYSSNPWNLKYFLAFLFAIEIGFTSCIENKGTDRGDESFAANRAIVLIADSVETVTPLKLELTKQYCLENYGIFKNTLDSPQMILVHYTVIPTLESTIELFKKDSISSNRKNISRFSQLNVGIHYVVDKDGKLYHLMPDTLIARHVIGFNHVAIGIENIARDETELTQEQLATNAALVAFLKAKYEGIDYLVGHHEYNNATLPHYALYKSVNEEYQPYNKPDPGDKFMKDLREMLRTDYGLAFKE